MQKILATALLAISLTACTGDLIKPSESQDRSYYVVDLKDYSLCLGDTGVCQNLTTITNSPYKAEAIEALYQQKVSGPNYRGSLLKMMLRPQDKSYTVEKISNDGRYYKLPINEKTQTVWDTLKRINDTIYQNNS